MALSTALKSMKMLSPSGILRDAVVRVRGGADPADQRLDHVFGERGHHRGERGADDDRGRQVDDVASCDELSEPLQHGDSPFVEEVVYAESEAIGMPARRHVLSATFTRT